ncbi:MAG: rod shape-determining protein MreC [Fidelibacterota bacterium]
MRGLLGFLYERRDYVVLLIAVSLSFTLLSSNQSPSIQILRGKINTVFSVVYSPVLWVRGVTRLRAENALLREKVTQLTLLNSSLLQDRRENQRLRTMLDYKRRTRLDLVPARVTSSGISPLASAITIDVGRNHGIGPNTGVMGIAGIVGKTVSAGNRSSVVQLLTDYNFRASVKLENSGTVGILRWKQKDSFEVWEIPRTVQVQVGERIVTSGFSDIFPENLPVGKVTGFRDSPELLHKVVTGRPYTDFTALENVFAVRKRIP